MLERKKEINLGDDRRTGVNVGEMLNWVIREGLSEKMTLNKDLQKVKEPCGDRKSDPGRRSHKFPKVGE